jgi:hypothetical protein
MKMLVWKKRNDNNKHTCNWKNDNKEGNKEIYQSLFLLLSKSIAYNLEEVSLTAIEHL